MIYFFIFLGVVCLGALYLLVRGWRVAAFRIKIINLCYDCACRNDLWGRDHALWDIYRGGASYNAMLYSFKKLTLENWLTAEEIKILKS